MEEFCATFPYTANKSLMTPPGGMWLIDEHSTLRRFAPSCLVLINYPHPSRGCHNTYYNLHCIYSCAIRQSQIEGDSKFYGSGSFVSHLEKFFLLTCCHNFLPKEDGNDMLSLKDGDMEKKMRSRCKRAKYLCSTKDFKGTVALPANVVLMNREDPVLIFDKVGHS